MLSMGQPLPKLEDLCLKRICRDVVRHALNNQLNSSSNSKDEYSDYSKFQRMFGERVLDDVGNSKESVIDIKEKYFESSPTGYLAFVKFLFNRYVNTILINEDMDFDEDMANIISANCGQKLLDLTMVKKNLRTSFSTTFLISMENMVHLNLYECSIESVRTMKVISDFLVHLRRITLVDSAVEDKDLFVLCGHDWPFDHSIFECSFSKNCSAKCKLLKLERIDLGKDLWTDDISSTGVACLITHIPTLKYVSSSPTVENVVHMIAEYRRKHGISGIQLLLDEGYFDSGPERLKAFLEACPILRVLEMDIENTSHSNIVSRNLEESKLESLSSFRVNCNGIGLVSTARFRNFWLTKGPKLRHLHMSLGSIFNSERDDLYFILKSCSEVSNLYLHGVLTGTEEVFHQVLCSSKLQYLWLALDGDNDFINTFARNIILKAPRLETLVLNFSVNSAILLPVLSEHHLQCLKGVVIHTNTRQEAEKITKFLCSGKRKTVVSAFYR